MDLTEDGIFDRSITVMQPRQGYRFALDSVLLGCFAMQGKAGRVLDLGSGSGVVGFILLARGGAREVTGIEVDDVLSEASRLGAARNGFADRFAVIQGDLRDRSIVGQLGKMDLVVSNPPYHRRGSGLESPETHRARARHDGSCTLGDVVDVASSVLCERGRLCVVLPPGRMGEFVHLASLRQLHLARLRPVYPRADRESRMILMEARLRGSPDGCVVEQPLIIHDPGGSYTREAESLLRLGPT